MISQLIYQIGYLNRTIKYDTICLQIYNELQDYYRIGNDYLNIGIHNLDNNNIKKGLMNLIKARDYYDIA